MLTQQWQGECPGVGVKVTVSSSAYSSSTSSAWPASTIGRQLSRNTVPGGLLPLAFSASQTAYSLLWKTYFAFGKVGTQRPSRSVVFQPVWSMCKWVQNT